MQHCPLPRGCPTAWAAQGSCNGSGAGVPSERNGSARPVPLGKGHLQWWLWGCAPALPASAGAHGAAHGRLPTASGTAPRPWLSPPALAQPLRLHCWHQVGFEPWVLAGGHGGAGARPSWLPLARSCLLRGVQAGTLGGPGALLGAEGCGGPALAAHSPPRPPELWGQGRSCSCSLAPQGVPLHGQAGAAPSLPSRQQNVTVRPINAAVVHGTACSSSCPRDRHLLPACPQPQGVQTLPVPPASHCWAVTAGGGPPHNSMRGLTLSPDPTPVPSASAWGFNRGLRSGAAPQHVWGQAWGCWGLRACSPPPQHSPNPSFTHILAVYSPAAAQQLCRALGAPSPPHPAPGGHRSLGVSQGTCPGRGDTGHTPRHVCMCG